MSSSGRVYHVGDSIETNFESFCIPPPIPPSLQPTLPLPPPPPVSPAATNTTTATEMGSVSIDRFDIIAPRRPSSLNGIQLNSKASELNHQSIPNQHFFNRESITNHHNQSINHQNHQEHHRNHHPNHKSHRKSSIIVNVTEDPAFCTQFLTLFSVVLVITSLPFSLFFCIKVVQEYERAVIFRLGRLVSGGARGPGIFFIIPCIDTYSKVDLRTVSFDVPPQEILSKDSVTVAVDAVVYFRISNAIASVSNVEDYARSTRLLAATTLRNVLGTKNLSEILSERESISHMIQSSLDEATDSWGVKVERVEVKDARLPFQLQRAMAAEAEATREARAKVIAAEGEQRASKALKEAAEVIMASPAALQLRYLQTLSSIAGEKNSTIVFPVPMELFRGFTVGTISNEI